MIFDLIEKTGIMKKIILLVFLTFGTQLTFAECTVGGIQFFPKQQEISINSMFMIQGYYLSQETIRDLKKMIVYLEDEEGEFVVLNLQELLEGQRALTQAIFKPSEALKPKTTYLLKYCDQIKNEEKESLPYGNKRVSWITTDKEFIESLPPNLDIVFEETEVIYYGCGPSVNAIFTVRNKNTAVIWYKTEVVELATNKKTTFYIKDWKGTIAVGHGMCGGAFAYNEEGAYKARFTPMNIDGKSLATTDWKTFKSPFENDTGY